MCMCICVYLKVVLNELLRLRIKDPTFYLQLQELWAFCVIFLKEHYVTNDVKRCQVTEYLKLKWI